MQGDLPGAGGTGPAVTALALERAAAAHWRGTEEEWLGEWLLRAAGGFTGRANSALPLGDPGMPLDAALDYVTGWYRARGLPAMISVPLPLPLPLPLATAADAPAGWLDGDVAADLDAGLDRGLAERGWQTRPGPAFVMVAGLPLAAGGNDPAASPAADAVLAAGAAVAVDAVPSAAWLDRYHYRGTDNRPPVLRDVLTSAEDQAFVSIKAGSDVLAIARLSLAEGWAGLTAVEVDPRRRRAGLGHAITAGACAEAVRRGVSRVFLQVEEGNVGAQRLYQRCGFRYSHRYHYRVAPASRL